MIISYILIKRAKLEKEQKPEHSRVCFYNLGIIFFIPSEKRATLLIFNIYHMHVS